MGLILGIGPGVPQWGVGLPQWGGPQKGVYTWGWSSLGVGPPKGDLSPRGVVTQGGWGVNTGVGTGHVTELTTALPPGTVP